MKNSTLLSILLLAVFLTGCLYEELPPTGGKTGEADTYIRVKVTMPHTGNLATTRSTDNLSEPTVVSMRIMIFYGDGTLEVFTVQGGGATPVWNNVSGLWEIETAVLPAMGGDAVVYVILNELPEWSNTLDNHIHTLSQLRDFIADNPLLYEELQPVTSPEPAFPMVVYGNVYIPSGVAFLNATLIDLTTNGYGFAAERTMAKVIIERVSNHPLNPLDIHDPDFLAESSLVFITEIGLRNVPNRHSWAPNWSWAGGTNKTRIHPTVTHTHNNFIFPLPEEDMLRRYYGKAADHSVITLNVSGEITEIERAVGSRIWYTGRGAGANAYSTDREALTNYLIANPNNISSASFQANFPDVNNITVQQFRALQPLNSGNFPVAVIEIFTGAGGTGNFLPAFLDIAPGAVTGVGVEGALWELREQNIAYYMPEHILTNCANATSLHIQAVKIGKDQIAESELQITPESFDRTTVQWNINQPTTDANGWIVRLGRDDITLAEFENDFSSSIDLIWGYELDVVRVGNTDHFIVRHYWDIGAQRSRTGTITAAITAGITTEHVFHPNADKRDFSIPINNISNPDNFNIYRNHVYRFSIHVVYPWWNTSGTRSANVAAPFVLQRVE